MQEHLEHAQSALKYSNLSPHFLAQFGSHPCEEDVFYLRLHMHEICCDQDFELVVGRGPSEGLRMDALVRSWMAIACIFR